MKNYVLAVCGIGVMLSSGCASSRMALKRIDQDIPSVLVERYNKASSPRIETNAVIVSLREPPTYVDRGQAWNLPLLMQYEEHVAKTANGFQAYQGGGVALGLLVKTDMWSDFDAKGTLLKKEQASSLITGLLLSTHSVQEERDEAIKKAGAWSVLWGAIGLSEDTDEAKRLSLLWIPIPVSRGNANR